MNSFPNQLSWSEAVQHPSQMCLLPTGWLFNNSVLNIHGQWLMRHFKDSLSLKDSDKNKNKNNLKYRDKETIKT